MRFFVLNFTLPDIFCCFLLNDHKSSFHLLFMLLIMLFLFPQSGFSSLHGPNPRCITGGYGMAQKEDQDGDLTGRGTTSVFAAKLQCWNRWQCKSRDRLTYIWIYCKSTMLKSWKSRRLIPRASNPIHSTYMITIEIIRAEERGGGMRQGWHIDAKPGC